MEQSVKIYKIEMLDGKIIEFENNEIGYAFRYKDKIVSIEKKGEIKTFQVSEIKKVYTEKFDYVKTFFVVVGSAAALFIALFVYIGIQLRDITYGG